MSDTRPTIPPEVGKRYVMRDGHTTGTIKAERSFFYPFRCFTYTWAKDGSYRYDGQLHHNDLIAEYTGNVEPWTVPDDVGRDEKPDSPICDYVVWSNEHCAWWGPFQRGYFTNLNRAGRYSRDEALSISRGIYAWLGDGKNNPDEIPIRLEDAEALIAARKGGA